MRVYKIDIRTPMYGSIHLVAAKSKSSAEKLITHEGIKGDIVSTDLMKNLTYEGEPSIVYSQRI